MTLVDFHWPVAQGKWPVVSALVHNNCDKHWFAMFDLPLFGFLSMWFKGAREFRFRLAHWKVINIEVKVYGDLH